MMLCQDEKMHKNLCDHAQNLEQKTPTISLKSLLFLHFPPGMSIAF
jgi:hypothetical protein